MNLADRSCSRSVSLLDVTPLLAELPGWSVADQRLVRTYTFPDFASALAFVVKVGAMADEQDHHPDVELSWGKARIAWWTHSVGGLSINDAICAARCDRLAAA